MGEGVVEPGYRVLSQYILGVGLALQGRAESLGWVLSIFFSNMDS